MSIRLTTCVRPDGEAGWRMTVESEPHYVVGFSTAIDRTELESMVEDRWIVLCIPVWSGPDRKSIPIAVDLAKRYEGRLRLGLVPFDDTKELRPIANQFRIGERWITGMSRHNIDGVEDAPLDIPFGGTDFATPIYLFVRFGKAKFIYRGPLDADSISSYVAQYLEFDRCMMRCDTESKLNMQEDRDQ